MKSWRTAALTAAVLAAAGAGAALAPVAHGQSTRVVTPQGIEAFTFGGGRIGVSVSDLRPDADAQTTSGVRVESVEEGSPAEEAGLRGGDIVVEFDGERVRSVRQFTRLVSETPVGRTVTAAVQRDGQRVTVNVAPRESSRLRLFEGDSRRQLEELRNLPYALRRAPEAPEPFGRDFEALVFRGSQLGITTQDLSPQLAEYFGAKDGVLVGSVRADSPAAKTGLKAGDVITGVNGATIESASELRRQLQRIERGEEFTLSIVRDRKTMTLKGKIEAPRPARWTAPTIV